ncbi:hypothetical protein MMC13_007473 [Lambiella insularis]|nr:hypothetical protein [Lambiella insularis]
MESPKPDIVIYSWYPRGVKSVIASGGSNFIGLVDENTVLKYPNLPSRESSGLDIENGKEKIYRILRQEQQLGLVVEEQILEVLGQHHRIISFKGKYEDGLLLEYMPNGLVADYLCNSNPRLFLKERLKWALQAAEAVAYVYIKGVFYCDVGKLLHPDGTIRLDGESAEDTKSSMPRLDPNNANQKTDIFALGSAIYFIIEGHPPFPELDSRKDMLEIVSRFKSYQFPALDEELVVQKCWAGKYESADEVVRELKEMNTT